MNSLPFEISNSLMDRFIKLYLDKPSGLKEYVRSGILQNEALRIARTEWFDRNAIDISWQVEEYEGIDSDILDAVYLTFAILGNQSKVARYKQVSEIFNDIVRLAVAQKNEITSYSKYHNCITRSDAILQNLLFALGVVIGGEKDNYNKYLPLQIRGEEPTSTDITLGNIESYIRRRLEVLEDALLIAEGDAERISKIIAKLRANRNREAHSAFYTDPSKYWNRLVYSLFDYITIVFFLMRYYDGVYNKYIIPCEDEDLDAVAEAFQKANEYIETAQNISVRFEFEQSKDKRQKLTVKPPTEKTTGWKPRRIPFPATDTREDGTIICYYELQLKRNNKYNLQAYYVKNEVDVEEGEALTLDTNLLFDGALIKLRMPTTEIPYPSIDDIIARATGLIEDSENRKILEKLLAFHIQDEPVRDKIRILLQLKEGDKEPLMNEFIEKRSLKDDEREKLNEEFRLYLENKSNLLQEKIDNRFEEITAVLNSNNEELKELVSELRSDIDIRDIISASDAEMKQQISSLQQAFASYSELFMSKLEENADEARSMNASLLSELKNSALQIKTLRTMSHVLLHSIAEIKTDLNKQTELHGQTHSKLDQQASQLSVIQSLTEDSSNVIQELSDNINADKNTERKKKKIRRICRIFTAVIITTLIVISMSFGLILSKSTAPFITTSELLSKLAHNIFRNPDVAFERAKYLESTKDYKEATNWYRNARERYASILSENDADYDRALKMTKMLMQNKGGFHSYDIEKYARMAKRFDIVALVAAKTGDYYKAKDIINNYQGEHTDFLKLADAVSALSYPREDKSIDFVRKQWCIIDSLASTENVATEEALLAAFSICQLGVLDKNNEHIIAPSLYDAVAYATDADEQFNSLQGQVFLAGQFESLGQYDKAEYYFHKSTENGNDGNGEVTFSHTRINELENDAQALAARAHNNAVKGFTDYQMTAAFYHKADSINREHEEYLVGAQFYRDWFDFIVMAEDLKTREQLLPLIRKDLPDSIRQAVADYIMAAKCNENQKSSAMEYLKKASDNGLEEATVALAILWDMDSIPEGIEIVKRLAYKKDFNPTAVRYLLVQDMNNGVVDYDLLSKIEYDMGALKYKLYNMAFIYDLMQYDSETLRSLANQINICLSMNSDMREGWMPFLMSKLAEIEYLLGNIKEAEFYLETANNLSKEMSYSSLFGISEIARKRGDFETAAYFAGRFAKLYFMNGGKVRDEKNRDKIVELFYYLYPEILELAKTECNYDFNREILFFPHDKFNRDNEMEFRNFPSRVENLKIDFPEIRMSAFTITQNYFE